MRLSPVILPIHRRSEGQKLWQRAEDLGFHSAYTYDHLAWRTFRDGPWFGAVPTLTAAAAPHPRHLGQASFAHRSLPSGWLLRTGAQRRPAPSSSLRRSPIRDTPGRGSFS